jgi:hypothetical protein
MKMHKIKKGIEDRGSGADEYDTEPAGLEVSER